MTRFAHERINRRTLLKVAGGLLLATAVDLRLPGRDAAAMTRMEWVERDLFPSSGRYQSPVFRADGRFNSIELSWLADLPAGAALEFAVRSSPDGATWTDWVHVHPDSHTEPNGADGRIYAPPVLTGADRCAQYRVDLIPNALGERPTLREVRLAGVDTSAPARLLAEGQDAPLIDGYIIPRAGWGADESLRMKDDKEIWKPEYQPIQKVIVHHTVTTNAPADPAAAVRAMYYYHAVTLGWGDIGYNFLIDWQGNIYEGRFGGPNVVGGHALQYNRGSLGIALIGTFTEVDPPKAMLDALVRLIKGRAPHVDPAGWTPFVDKENVPNICGHRDVLATECPGDALYPLLPVIRGWIKGTGPIYPPPAAGESRAELVSVSYAPATVYAGMPVQVTAVVKNTGPITIYGQDPTTPYTYIEGQDFNDAGFPKILGNYRVGVDVSGNDGVPNPFRWGFPGSLPPGHQAAIRGEVRFTETGERQLTASLVQEFIRYHQEGVFPQTIQVLPPPTTPAPPSDEPGMHYFEVTQHNVPDIFYQYWLANGGLERFGYPLTEVFDELSETDGKVYPTQYFERARFEHHREYAGTEYEVLLGLLGRERTRGREGEPAFQPLSSGESTDEVDFFPETGHTLGFGFRDYWRANGGIPVFGYPISREFQERSKTDGQVYTVQYFERARFEWHPEFRGTKYEYLLGHLAREVLIDRGWLPAGG